MPDSTPGTPREEASGAWRYIVATRGKGKDTWDVALFATRELAETYYTSFGVFSEEVAEGAFAQVEIHHERPNG